MQVLLLRLVIESVMTVESNPSTELEVVGMAQKSVNQPEDDEFWKRRSKFGDDHKRLSKYGEYPPFSIDKPLRDKFYAAIRAAGDSPSSDFDEHARIFEDYAQQIEEAEMYIARFGDEVVDAQKVAADLAGIKMSDDRVVRLTWDFDYDKT